VGGVAGNEAAAVAVVVGDQFAPRPRHHAQNFELEIAADGAADRGFDLGLGVFALLGAADDGEAPLVAAIDGDDGRPGAFRADEDVAVSLALVVQRQQMRAAEDDVGGVGQHRIALHGNAERFAYQAARAVAADDIARRNLFTGAGVGVLDHRRHLVGILRERDEAGAIAQRHAWLRRREGAQDRVEHVLRAALALLRAFLRRHCLADTGKALAAKLVAGHAGEVDIVLDVIARVGRALDRRYQAPAPAELHGADADHVHARLIDRAVALLDQHAGDAAPAEIAGQRQTDRPAADDENWYAGLPHVFLACRSTAAARNGRANDCIASR
jgi:hypothetical protein